MATKRPVVDVSRRPADADSTILAPRPDMTDDTGASLEELDSGLVFEDSGIDDDLEVEATTAGGKKKLNRLDLTVNAADVSLIEAQSEMFTPAPSLEGFDSPRVTSANLGIVDDGDTNPPTEILRLALSDPGSDPILDTSPSMEAPAIVKKWRMGQHQQQLQQQQQQRIREDELEADTPAPLTASGRGAFALPPTDQGQGAPATPGGGTRVDASPGGGARAAAGPLDVAELRRTLEEAEKLMRTVKVQLSGMDLGASRGTNAQVAAALHRLGEAIAMLKHR